MKHAIVGMTLLLCGSLAAPTVAAERAPRDCLDNRSIRESRFSSTQGYFARAGRDWWQNKARGCELLDPDRSIRTLSPINRQCSGDQILVFQNFSRVEFGTCVLGQWEPVAADAVPPPGGRAPKG